MKITIEFDSTDEVHMDALATLLGVNKPATRSKKKAAEPPVENPDEPAKPAAEPAAEPAAPAADDLAKFKDATKESCGKETLRLSKEVGRQAAVDILESFRPEGFTEELVKVSSIPAEQYPALAKKIADAFTAAGK